MTFNESAVFSPHSDLAAPSFTILERDPIPGHHRLIEREPAFGAVPLGEFANGMAVGALRAERWQSIDNRCFGLLKIGQPQNSFRDSLAFIFSPSLHSALWMARETDRTPPPTDEATTTKLRLGCAGSRTVIRLRSVRRAKVERVRK
jgi:hypothetical protein